MNWVIVLGVHCPNRNEERQVSAECSCSTQDHDEALKTLNFNYKRVQNNVNVNDYSHDEQAFTLCR